MKLRDDLSWCAVDGAILLLDLRADRYLRLPDDLVRPFLRLAEAGWRAVDEAGLDRLARLGLLVPGEAAASRVEPPLPPPSRDLLDGGAAPPRPLMLLAVLVAEALFALRLRRRRLAAILARIRRRAATARVGGEGEALRFAAAFERAALLLGRTDRCLPRALAAWSLCRRRGIGAALVFGVRLSPFTAHCWVQLGDAVLVGDFEQARLFTPILVLR